MKKSFVRAISLILIFSLVLSSSPLVYTIHGKCDPDDAKCKKKKQAKKSCKDADNVAGCRDKRDEAKRQLGEEAARRRAGMVSPIEEETDPQKAGDLAWDACKQGGGGDANCRAQAETAYLEVEKSHPVDAFTKQQHIVRDTLRKTALQEAGGSEALAWEQAERIRQESDVAVARELKEEHRQDFYNALKNKVGKELTPEELTEYFQTEEYNRFEDEYFNNNKGQFELAIGKEADLAKLGKELLQTDSVSEHIQQQQPPKEAPPEKPSQEAQRQQFEQQLRQEVMNLEACDNNPAVQVRESGDLNGWYRCSNGERISPQAARSALAALRKPTMARRPNNQDFIPATIVSPKQIESMRETLESMANIFRQRRLVSVKEEQLATIEQENQDFIPATIVSQKQIESVRETLESMANIFRRRQKKNPLEDNDSDGVLNFTDCDPDDERYQGDCSDQERAPSQYEVHYSDATDLQIKGVITNNEQLVAGEIILKAINPETGKYEVVPVEFNRYGQFTSNSFNLTIGPLVEPAILHVNVFMDGQLRRVIVPIIPSEEGVFSIQNIHLEDYAVGTEDELIEQIREKYNINVINGPNPENLWSAQEIQWFEETLNELPPIFWQTETTDFYRDSSDEYFLGLFKPQPRPISRFIYPLVKIERPSITMFDEIYSLNNRTWTKNSKSDDTKGFFKQVLVHELTHAIQYHDPIKSSSPEWDRVHPEVAGWSNFLVSSVNTYANPLVQDYMKTIGWEIDWLTVYTFRRYTKSETSLIDEDAPTSYAKTNPLEDMAESTMLYVSNPEYLRKRSPERYDWIKDNIFNDREYITGSGNNTLLEQIIKKLSFCFPSFQFTARANQSLPPTSLEKIESVKPGMSRDEVVNILGEPISERTISDDTFLSYPSSNSQIAHVIILQNSQVILTDIYKGAENPEKPSEFTERYGEPEITYSYFAEGARTSIYAEQGLALVSLEGGEYIVKKQTFSPMPTEQFLATLGKNLPLSDPFVQGEFSTPNTSENTYQLLEGWNFVSFPVVPQSFSTAAELVTDAARQDAYITTVARWDGSKWEEYVQRGDQAFGQDFPIEPGVAYMLRNHIHLKEWKVSGFRIGSPIPLELKTGFNSVGIPYSETEHTASTVLDEINLVKAKKLTPESENADLISRFVSGNWDVFIKRIYSEEDIQEYGNNFKILPSEGYFIKVKREVNWTP